MGPKWRKMESKFKGRCAMNIKNCLNSLLKTSLFKIYKLIGNQKGYGFLNKVKAKTLSTFVRSRVKINYDDWVVKREDD